MSILNFFQKIYKSNKGSNYSSMHKELYRDENEKVIKKVLEKHNISPIDIQKNKDIDILRSKMQFDAITELRDSCSYLKSLVFYIIKYPIILMLLLKSNKQVKVENKNIIILHNDNQKNRLNTLPNEYSDIFKYKAINPCLNIKDLLYLIKVYKHFIGKVEYSELFLKIIINIAKLSNVASTNYNKNIINSFEYSYSSSCITNYLNKNGHKHINVMHGEKLFYVRDSFSRFDEFYVWGEYYRDLFVSLGCEASQFKTYQNPHFSELAELKSNDKVEGLQKATFYWTPAIKLTESVLKELKSIQEPYILNIRFHPSYEEVFQKELKIIKESLGNSRKIVIEDPRKIDIKESLIQTDLVIGTYSTVIIESIVTGKKIYIIEDEVMKVIKDYYPIYYCDSVVNTEDKILTRDILKRLYSI